MQVPIDAEARKLDTQTTMRSAILCLLAILLLPCASHAQAPVFTINPAHSSIKFSVKSSVALTGKFDKWNATLTFPSANMTTGVLHIQIAADTVDTGSGMKNNKLKSKDFFDVQQYPSITFRSTKLVQTSPTTFDVDGNFSIRGVSRLETLKLTIPNKGIATDAIKGVLIFNRKHYGMDKGIPFVRIEDHVEVTIDLKLKER